MASPQPDSSPRRSREEEDLAREAQAGSVRAFEELVARFESPLFHFLCLRTRDAAEAEEVCQDAFLRAWQNLGRYDSRWRFSTVAASSTRDFALSTPATAVTRSFWPCTYSLASMANNGAPAST